MLFERPCLAVGVARLPVERQRLLKQLQRECVLAVTALEEADDVERPRLSHAVILLPEQRECLLLAL